MTTLRSDPAAIRAYLDALFGTAEDGFLAVWTAEDRRTAWFPVADLDRAAAAIAALSDAGLNAYIGMGLQAESLGAFRRGTAATVVGIPGAWDDLDVAGAAHAQSALPPSREAALAVLAAFPLRHSLLVESGHGFYPLWLFRECWCFDNEADRCRATLLVALLQQAIRAAARRHGYDLETTGDLARVLRPVGALNRKPGLPPAPVRLLEDTGLRYAVEEIEAVLPEATDPPVAPRVWTGSSTPTADLKRILAGCAYLRHCRDDAATLDEPSWHALLSIVARCRDGGTHAHALSSVYPSYDPAETDQKFAYAVAANRPLRCRTIRQRRGGEPYCAVCPHWGVIPGPVVLGYGAGDGDSVRRDCIIDPTVPLRPRPAVTLRGEG